MSLLNQNIPELKANSIDAIHYKIMDIMKNIQWAKHWIFLLGGETFLLA